MSSKNPSAFATDRQEAAVQAYKAYGSQRKAAESLGISLQSLQNLLKRAERKSDAPIKGPDEGVESEETNDGLYLNVRSYERIQTAEQAMAKAGINPEIWEPVKIKANSWEVALKQLDGSAKTVPLWQVSVTCNRRVPKFLENATDIVAKRAVSGYRPSAVKRFTIKDPSTMVLGLVDHHFGKLAWKPEVGDNYDLQIAEDLYAAAIDHSLDRWKNAEVAKIIIPLGNDFCHIDTRAGTTEAGTIQDVDGRYEKIAAVMEQSVMRCVERAREIADVDVIWVGGNHDRVTSMWLCRCVHWAFESCRHVTVDTSPCSVKYRQFGECLLGFSHGDGPREKALKDMMPLQSDDWAKAKACREWLTGHLHQQKTTERISTHEQAGMVFRILPSLCGTDRWHFNSGFSMSQKATQSLLYSHKFGMSEICTYHIGRYGKRKFAS